MNPYDLAKLLTHQSNLEAALARFEVWLLVFGVLVVIGVGGESVFGIRTWWNNRKLQEVNRQLDQYRQEQVAEINRKAAEAEAKAEGFRSSIAEAQQKSAEAEERAAEANLELARLKTPRTLSPEQQKVIIDAVKDFPKTPFDFFVSSDDEAVRLTETLENCLMSAGWDRVDLDPSISVHMDRGGGKKAFALWVGTGVAVEFSQSRMDLAKAASALVEVLKKEGLGAEGFAAAKGVTPNAIHIKIGKKP